MHEAVDFYWFSGSGNTLLIVEAMSEVFRHEGHTVRMIPIRETTRVERYENRCIGIGVPVAEQGTYPFIWKFLNELPEIPHSTGPGSEIFFVDTLMMYSGGIVGPLKRLVLAKGFNPIGAKEIFMPNNLFPRSINHEKVGRLQGRGIQEARRLAHALCEGTARWRRIPVLPWFWVAMNRSKTIWRWMRQWAGLACDTSLCTKCSLCEQLCPVSNIQLNPYPTFGDRCEVCLRCYSLCPEGAVFSARRRDRQSYAAVSAREMLAAERKNSWRSQH